VYERLGSPEGELALAECVVYLAVAPKSNAVLQGLQRGARLREAGRTRPVPMHLRNAPTKLMKELDYGKGYRYAHDEEGGFAAGERYLPEGMAEPLSISPCRAGWRSGSAKNGRAAPPQPRCRQALSHHAGSQKVVSVKENPALNRPGGLHRPDKIAPLLTRTTV
jgi:hypothetical protein